MHTVTQSPHCRSFGLCQSSRQGFVTITRDSDFALKEWCRLGYRLHQEQLNLCRFYEEAGVLYLAAGLVAHANIEKSQAEIVAYVIWQYKMDKQKTLLVAYEAIREMHLALDVRAPSAEESKRQRHDPVTEPADETAGPPDEEQEEEAIPLRHQTECDRLTVGPT